LPEQTSQPRTVFAVGQQKCIYKQHNIVQTWFAMLHKSPLSAERLSASDRRRKVKALASGHAPKTETRTAASEALLVGLRRSLERVRGTTGADGVEHINTHAVMDTLKVPQRKRTPEAYGQLTILMTQVGWTAIRRLSLPGYQEQIVGYFRKPGAVRSEKKHPKHWSDSLPFGLPERFDFRVIRTDADVATLIGALPNRDRGRAAKLIYGKRNVLGKQIAYSALLKAWQHDHDMVRDAFGDDRKFVNALSRVSPPSKKKRSVRVWRGINRLEGALGASWTTDRDLACWFAMRYFERCQTAFLFTCLLRPDQIVTEYNGRSEREVIPNPDALVDRVFLDEGNGKLTIKLTATLSKDDVSPAAISNWRRGCNRTGAKRQAEHKARLRAARRRLAEGQRGAP
jgi:hypothetical protein